MNLFTSPLSFSKNPQPCGLFSSQTAFRKPNVPHTFFTSSDKNHSLPAFIHPKDLANKQPNKPVKILHKIEDQDLILCEPVKKVKQAQPELSFFDKANMNKPQQNICKTSRLTIEDVFETPVMPTLTKKVDLTEECFNDDDDASSLSFISSCSSSLDDLDDDDVILVSRRKSSDCMIIEPVKEQKHGGDMRKLVVKDDILGRLSYTNQENLVVKNSEIYPLVEPNLKELAFGAPLCIPPNNVNRFFDFNKYSQRIMRLSLNFSDKTSNDLIENSKNLAVDGYDSDSSATKSTSIEQEASQKGASPAYGPIPGSYNEENYTQNRLKAHLNNEQKKEKLINRSRKPRDKVNIKDKKKSLMNLKLDLNPKQLKVERRLNRLQLLRYQQGVLEDEDEEIKKFGISDLLSRANSSIPESNEIQINNNGMSKINNNEAHLAFDHFILEDSQAVIPPLEETRGVRRRVVQQVWDPETIDEEHIEEYLWRLSEILEIPVNNIEAALKLLNSFNKNICDTLKTVEENKVFYFELFRLKVRRQRRRGA